MLHHYITKYRDENNELVITSWIQLNIFGRAFCFSEKAYRSRNGKFIREGKKD
jgi:hypothetical protein